MRPMEVWTRFSDVEFDEPSRTPSRDLAQRKAECDEFYAAVQDARLTDDENGWFNARRWQVLLWCKRFYNYHVHRWLEVTDPTDTASRTLEGRNSGWQHIVNENVLSMPDAWEYPWYAAWDMGFHCVTMALVDPVFAKKQIHTMLSSLYQHPHGQTPAYEWNFSDTNPPVLAWAAWQVYLVDCAVNRRSDIDYLATTFRALLISLTEWLHTKDPAGNDLFGGGFLGWTTSEVFNRDEPRQLAGNWFRSMAPAWVAQMALQMIEIAVELSRAHGGYAPTSPNSCWTSPWWPTCWRRASMASACGMRTRASTGTSSCRLTGRRPNSASCHCNR